ncbi:MAG TPA: SRPBCC family protein [Candidatus Dormibacteraeota bacterium]
MALTSHSYGTVDALDDGRWRLHFTRTLHHPVERVWRAVTEPGHLAAWFPSTIEGQRRTGARLRFDFPNGEAAAFAGEVIAFDPPHAFEFLWGTDLVRIELREFEGGTVLTLLDTLDERGKAARDGAGWHCCLDALETALDGNADAHHTPTAWSALHPGYVERFGPEGSSIGPPDGAA